MRPVHVEGPALHRGVWYPTMKTAFKILVGVFAAFGAIAFFLYLFLEILIHILPVC